MQKAVGVCVLLLVLSIPASADPISAGIWSPHPIPGERGVPFYDGASFDCSECGVAFWLPAGVEYLGDSGGGGAVAFRFANFPGASLVFRLTAWNEGWLSWDSETHEFSYDTGTGFLHRSTEGLAMALFRMRRAGATEYWLAVEDLPAEWPHQDRDFNDAVYHWILADPTGPNPGPDPGPRPGPGPGPGPGPDADPDPVPTPEPGTLALVAGSAVAMLARRISRTHERRRVSAAVRP